MAHLNFRQSADRSRSPDLKYVIFGAAQVRRQAAHARRDGAMTDEGEVWLSAEEREAVAALASALPPAVRGRFFTLVAGRLAAYPPGARGPGLVHRLGVEVQRDFLNVAVGIGRDGDV